MLTNHDLESMGDTSEDWIQSRTGMRERHIAAGDQAASDLGAEAAVKAMADAGISPEQIDFNALVQQELEGAEAGMATTGG